MSKVTSLTDGTPWKLILRMAIPMALGYFFNQIYSIADGIIVGQYLGVDALAAVGATSSLNNLFCSLVIGTTVGAGVLAGQYYGKAESSDQVSLAIANGTYFNLFISILLTLISVPFAKQWLALFRTPETVLADATVYMQVYLIGIVFMTMFYMSFEILRAFGDAKTPLYFMIVSSVVNILLDLLFVCVLSLGVFGAALATTLAQALACVLCLIYAFHTNPFIRGVVSNYAPDLTMMRKCGGIGMALGIQSALIYLSTSVLQGVVNGYGENTIAAFTITGKYEMILLQPILAWANAMTAFVSQNIGARKYDRILIAVKNSNVISIIYSVIGLLIFLVLGRRLSYIFVTDTEVAELVYRGMLWEAVFLYGLCLNRILRNLLTGAGDAAFSIYAGVVEIAARILLCFLLTAIPLIGIWGIWITTGLTWSAVAIFALIRYRSGKWKNLSVTA